MNRAHIAIFFVLTIFGVGFCQGTKTSGLDPEALELRIEAILRLKSAIPAAAHFEYSPRQLSTLPGFDEIDVKMEVNGFHSEPMRFLIAEKDARVIEYAAYEVNAEPKNLISEAARPGRGGGSDALVHLVVFDDLECPFCGQFNNNVVPELLKIYGTQIRIVYRDFPLEGHPWATHAAEDANCLAKMDQSAYWAAVDYLHEHGPDIDRALSPAKAIDDAVLQITRDRHLSEAELKECFSHPDIRLIAESIKGGQKLAVESTPTIFVNGLKVAGAPSVSDLGALIDRVLEYEKDRRTQSPSVVVQK